MKLSEFLVSDYWDFIQVEDVKVSRTSLRGFYKHLKSLDDERVSEGKPYQFKVPYTNSIVSIYEDRIEVESHDPRK